MNYRQIALSLIVICLFFLSSCKIESYSKDQQALISNGFKEHKYYPNLDLDTLNKFDSDKHKVGYWLQLLNKYGCLTETPSEAVFYRFAYFNKGWYMGLSFDADGARRYNKQAQKGKWLFKIADSASPPRKDTIVALNNIYSYYLKGTLVQEDKYKNGFFVYYKFYYSNGNISLCFDYEKKIYNSPVSFLLTNYKKDGKIEQSCYGYWKDGKMISKPIINDGKPVE